MVFATEPLITTQEAGKQVVLEGNRRLAAAKVILDPSVVDGKLDEQVIRRITSTIKKRGFACCRLSKWREP